MDAQPTPQPQPSKPRPPRRRTKETFTIRPRDRYWEVLDAAGTLVCLTVYKRGALEVVRRLGG